MLIGRVVYYQVDQNTDAALLCAVSELDEIAQCAVPWIDIVIVGDVVTAVPARRRLKRHQPDSGYAESMQIIEAPHESCEITDPVTIRVHVGVHRQAVDDRVLVPKIDRKSTRLN